MTRDLPPFLNVEQYERQATDLVHHGEPGTPSALAGAQAAIAHAHGFPNWSGFARHIETLTREASPAALANPLASFLEASVWHGSLDPAQAILSAYPEVARSGIQAAAVLGDDEAVRRFLASDPLQATAPGGPRGWDPLTCLCFSKYLRLDPARSPAFLRAAQALLDAGASASTGFFDQTHQPNPEFESALYGAAGVARHAELTRLLLDRGADPNDEEVPYHSPESYDNSALKVLVESGKVSPDSLTTMLLRKHDWHDFAGIKWLLEHGADPNRMTRWRRTPFHQAVERDNAIEIFEILLDHGADPSLPANGRSAAAAAARRGRGDLLALLDRRGLPAELHGLDSLLAACARDRSEDVRSLAAGHPRLPSEILAEGGTFLAQFAGVGNTAGVRNLLDLGIDVAERYQHGDGYWDVAPGSTALHVAAWRARHDTVRLLLERGAPVNVLDARGRTPLFLAVRACVDSYWMNRRSPESVRMLLTAGATLDGLRGPSGYDEVDDLLRRYQQPPE
jgi:ankyrin repeat protein